MTWGDPRSYRSDDRDLERCDCRLEVLMGENGDWYVSVVREGHKASSEYVRVTTSGSKQPEAANALADFYAALGPDPRSIEDERNAVFEAAVRAAREAGFQEAKRLAALICKKESDGWWALQSHRTASLSPGFCRDMGDAWTNAASRIEDLKPEDVT